jgi:hypothetical protein
MKDPIKQLSFSLNYKPSNEISNFTSLLSNYMQKVNPNISVSISSSNVHSR